MDLQRFLDKELRHREESIPVPELAESGIFDEGEELVWKVRGLSGAELGRVREAGKSRNSAIQALISASIGSGRKAQEIRKAFGLSDDEIPDDVSQRIEILVAGSVSPAIDFDTRDVAVKLGQEYAATLYVLTDKIKYLTGQGSEAVKPKPSGETTA